MRPSIGTDVIETQGSRTVRFAAGAAVLGSLVVLAGWQTGQNLLRSFLPGASPMWPLVAIYFILLGISLALAGTASPGTRRVVQGRMLAGAVLVFALLALLASVSDFDQGLQRALYWREVLATGRPHPGEPVPYAALLLGLLSAAIAALDTPAKGRVRPSEVLAVAAGALAVAVMLGYIYGSTIFFQTHDYQSIAVGTPLLAIVLAIGVLSARPANGFFWLFWSQTPGGVVTRRLVPAFILLPILTTWIRIALQGVGLVERTFGLVVMVMGDITIALALTANAVITVNRLHADRERMTAEVEEANRQLRRFNLEVEAEVARRTRELAEANQRLQEADRYKDEWLSVISHELRTPLNFITGFSSALEDDVAGPLAPRQADFVGKILRGTDRMTKLVDDLLDLSRLVAGKLQVDPEPTAYAPLVDEVRASMGSLAAARGLALEARVEPGLVVFADPARLLQVLTILVDNAIKFTAAGGTIVMGASSQDGGVHTEVRDTGIGIADTDVAKLFKRFSQVDMTATRKAGGTGLGLSIAKGIVEAHQGTIGVTTTPGAGSCFWFDLPNGA